MMKELKDVLTEENVAALRVALASDRFPGVTFQLAMQFILTNGILPANGLPASSFLALESWCRDRLGD